MDNYYFNQYNSFPSFNVVLVAQKYLFLLEVFINNNNLNFFKVSNIIKCTKCGTINSVAHLQNNL
jgi:hypothetical protein